MFIYPIYNYNWKNISTIYIYIYIYKTRLASNEIFSQSNKIHREVGRAKDLSALLYSHVFSARCTDKSLNFTKCTKNSLNNKITTNQLIYDLGINKVN